MPASIELDRPYPESPARNGSVEVARFIAAIGIVWFHEQVIGGQIGLAGLSVFTVFVVFYAKGGTPILKIWAAWSLLYLLANLADVVLTGQAFEQKFHFWMILTGPSLHLWFLPFAFAVVWIVKKGPVGIALLALLAVLGALIDPTEIPLAQYNSVLPPAIFGALLAQRYMPIVALLGVAAFAFTGYTPWILGCGAAALALLYTTPATNLTTFLGRISLPIYLAHPAVSAALKHAHMEPVPKAVATILCTIALATLLDQLPRKKVLGLR